MKRDKMNEHLEFKVIKMTSQKEVIEIFHKGDKILLGELKWLCEAKHYVFCSVPKILWLIEWLNEVVAYIEQMEKRGG